MNIKIINIISICLTLGFGAYIFLAGYAGSFNTTGPSSSSASFLSTALFIFKILVIVTLIGVLASQLDHSERAVVWAYLPIVAFILGIIFIVASGISRISNENKNISTKEKLMQNKIATFSRDYICPADLNAGLSEMFITLDEENNTLVYTLVEGSKDKIYNVETNPVGKIIGKNLELFYNPEGKLPFNDCLSKDRKTIHDDYEVIYKGEQDYLDYKLEKYDFLLDPNDTNKNKVETIKIDIQSRKAVTTNSGLSIAFASFNPREYTNGGGETLKVFFVETGDKKDTIVFSDSTVTGKPITGGVIVWEGYSIKYVSGGEKFYIFDIKK